MTIYTTAALIEEIENGVNPELLFFWGHQKTQGQITKSCFSQWYEIGFTVKGIDYKSAEHYMMAEKARLFGDLTAVAKVIACATPKEAKLLGRKIHPFNESIWAESCFDIVTQGNYEKFSQNPQLGEFLKSTSPAVIVEASPDDCIWGIGLAADHPDAVEPKHWRGTNLLGFALTKVREKLLHNE